MAVDPSKSGKGGQGSTERCVTWKTPSGLLASVTARSPVFFSQRWGPVRRNLSKRLKWKARPFFQDLPRCHFAPGPPGSLALRLFPREAPLCRPARSGDTSERPHVHGRPHFLSSTPLCDPSRPKYITKHILLIKTIVEAHKGKLLICVPACHFCLCE